MEWEVGGRFKREGTYVYLRLIHVDVWQKPTQYYKAIILRLKKKRIGFLIVSFHPHTLIFLLRELTSLKTFQECNWSA